MTIMTCDRREAALNRTLDSLRASDWGDEPLVVRDVTRHPDPTVSQVTTAHQVLTKAAGLEWDHLVFCEDDVLFN